MTIRRVWPFLYGVLGAVVAVIIIRVSSDPTAYFRYTQDAHPWTHPTRDVAFIVIATLLEGAIVSIGFRVASGPRLWPAALCLAIVLAPWLLLNLSLVVHAPEYRLIHLVWLFAVETSVVGIGVVSALLHAVTAIRSRSRAPFGGR